MALVGVFHHAGDVAERSDREIDLATRAIADDNERIDHVAL